MGKKKIICLLSMCLCLVMLSACGKQTVSASLEETVNDISTFTVSDDVKIVGLGEASHGAHEYQQMKAEVFQALVAKLLDIGITIDDEDTYLANINRVAFFNEDLVTVVIGRLHTVAADGDNKVGLLCFCTFGHE